MSLTWWIYVNLRDQKKSVTQQAEPYRSKKIQNFPKRRLLFAPLIFIQAYLCFTLLLFALGPVEFRLHNKWSLFAYAIAGQFAIAAGYFLGLYGKMKNSPASKKLYPRVGLYIATSLIVTLAITFYQSDSGLSLFEALKNPGDAYHAKAAISQHGISGRENLIISIPKTILSPFASLLIPGGVLIYSSMSRKVRGLWWIAVVGVALRAILIGTNKGLVDLILPVPWLLLLRGIQLQQVCENRNKKMSTRFSLWKVLSVAVVLFAVVISYFTFSIYSRAAAYRQESTGSAVGWSWSYGISLPAYVEQSIYNINNYLCQGYYGLDGCLNLDFVPCYGCGNSPFLVRRVAPIFTSNPDALFWDTYPGRLDTATGYSVATQWHTIYPWIASDITFPGAIIFIGIAGFIFSRAWLAAVTLRNIFAVGVFCHLLILFFYVPLNNTLFMYPEPMMAVLVQGVLWHLTCERGLPLITDSKS